MYSNGWIASRSLDLAVWDRFLEGKNMDLLFKSLDGSYEEKCVGNRRKVLQ